MVKASSLAFTPLQRRILSRLCQSVGDRITLSELARRTAATPAGVSKALVHLNAVGYVDMRSDPKMNVSFIELSRTVAALSYKRLENMRQIYESGLLEALIDSQPGSTIIVFGSYARGEDTVRSDIDIAVIGAQRALPELSAFERELARPINVQHFSSLADLPVELRESICSGVILEGGVEL